MALFTLIPLLGALPLMAGKHCRRGMDGLRCLPLAFWALWHCRHARPPDGSPA